MRWLERYLRRYTGLEEPFNLRDMPGEARPANRSCAAREQGRGGDIGKTQRPW